MIINVHIVSTMIILKSKMKKLIYLSYNNIIHYEISLFTMHQYLFNGLILLLGIYLIYNAYSDPQINIQLYRNNTYTIRGGQHAKFEQDILNRTLGCTLRALHDANEIDILIYRKYDGYYDISNKTIRYNHTFTDKFYSEDMIKHLGDCKDYLVIDCETR